MRGNLQVARVPGRGSSVPSVWEPHILPPRGVSNEMTGTWTIYESPIGPLTLVAGPRGLTDLRFPGKLRLPDETAKRPLPAVSEQLDAYFAGELRDFELPLDLHGNRLQLAVWRQLQRIPYGETISYGELAARVDPDLFPAEVEAWQRARIVGGVNGRNPVAIIVPCHRVIGADGSLTGYGGGLQRKQALLDLERGAAGGATPPPNNPQLAIL
jgi:methylated-DNA-[protein]-cysteine S-methyltransferase